MAMLKLLWPLLILNSRIFRGLIRQGESYIVQSNKTTILPGDVRRATSELTNAGDPDLAPELKAWRYKCFIFFDF